MDGDQVLRHRKESLDEDISTVKGENEWLPQQTKQAAKAMALLLLFSFIMFTVPFVVFFGTKHFVHEYFHLEPFQDNVVAVIAAVVTVNIIIALYVYIAYNEPEYDDQGNLIQEGKSDKSSLEIKQD